MGNLFDDQDNDPAARIAGLLFVRQEEDEPDQPGIFPMTVRVPSSTAALVSVMAEHAGLSRNEMVKLLLKAGIAESLGRIPRELAGEIAQEADARIEDFI